MIQNGRELISFGRSCPRSGPHLPLYPIHPRLQFLILLLLLILIDSFQRIKSKIKIRSKSSINIGYSLAGVGVALLMAITGCSKRPVTAATPATNTWKWESYPLTDKMRLGNLQCRILPRASVPITSPLSGLLRIYVDKQQTNLPAGFVWAEFEPKLLEASSNALAEAKTKLDERERLLLQLELPKQKLKLAREIEEAQRQIRFLEAALQTFSTNPVLGASIVAASPLKDRSLTEEALRRGKEELKLMRENYRYLEATNLAVLGVDVQTPRTELERRQLEFEHQQNQARFKVPYPMQLNISLQLAEGVSEYPVNTGMELAVLRDLSAIYLRVILSDPSWSTLPPENLKGVIGLPDGTRLEAPFSFKRLEKIQQREDSVYYFEFPTNRVNAAARLIGTDLLCELWLNLPERARIIPKLSLVMNHSKGFQYRRWNEAVSQLAPGARVLVEGQTDLAIAVPDKKHERSEK
jgi:hypothetical protein